MSSRSRAEEEVVRGESSGLVDGRVVCEDAERNQGLPVLMSSVAVDPQVLRECAVEAFDETVGLRMSRRREAMDDKSAEDCVAER